MSDTIIKVENVSKRFMISHESKERYTSLRDQITQGVKGVFRSGNKNKQTQQEEFWALRDLNFEIKRGDRVGIIGRNGAGKSTLLKILSRITEPSSGRIEINGRVASLLEVGTGFHPELSGRENIFLNGAILGMSRSEIRSKFDEIVSFAEVEKFLDTPVKRYSSGMYVRLAFAVAAHLEPEILIVDEVLAVGDAQFQNKCLGKMEDVSRNEGRTVLFVSHQLDAISRLCTDVLYLKAGEVDSIGGAQEIIHKYLYSDSYVSSSRSWNITSAPGSDVVRLLRVNVIDENKKNESRFDIRSRVGIQIHYRVLEDDSLFTHGFNLYDEKGLHILSSHDVNFAKTGRRIKRGDYVATVWIPGNFLSEMNYICSVAIMSYDPFIIHFHELDAVSFSVFDTLDGTTARGVYGGEFPGLIRPILEWS